MARTAQNAEELLWHMLFAFAGYTARSLLHEVDIIPHGSCGTRIVVVFGTVPVARGSERNIIRLG